MVQAARLLAIIVIVQSCYTGESELFFAGHGDDIVKIIVNYTRPETFDPFMHFPRDMYFRAGTTLSLNCTAPSIERAFYHWTSTCASSFASDHSPTDDGFIKAPYLRSVDGGEHTCTVLGNNEEMGKRTINVHVVGAGIYDSSAEVGLPNNSLIVAKENLDFKCLSGSDDPEVGYVLDINETDITEFGQDAFFTFQRTIGAVHVQSSRKFNSEDQGIYSCVIPDETGVNQTVYVGLYSDESDVTLKVTKIKMEIIEAGNFTLTCTTTGSPPTTVTWIKNNNTLTISESNGPYTSYQNMTDRHSSTYVNVLDIKGDADGVFRCNVSNHLLTNHSKKLIIPDLEVPADRIVGGKRVIDLIVGVKRVIPCTSYLNHRQIMWYKTEVRSSLNTSFAPNFTVEMTLTPDSVQRLNNVEFTCKAVTVSWFVVEKKVTMRVKEFSHNVSITGPPGPWLTDNEDPYTLTCHSSADTRQDLMWLDPDGREVVEDGALTVTDPVMSGKNTIIKLKFTKPNTSHAGTYTCVSIAPDRMPPSRRSSQWNVTIELPRPTVKIVSVPIDAPHFTGFEFNLLCTSVMSQAVDTDVTVTHIWSKGSRGWSRTWSKSWRKIQNGSRITVFPVDGENPEFNSLLQFSPLHKSDDGFYSCESTVYPAPDNKKSPYLKMSKKEHVKIPYDISPRLKTRVSIIYTPPDKYPDYAHPNYRAASSVTLNCTTEGESGRVSYRWSSTCKSCLARSYYKSELTEKILRTRDAGNHTCTATDSTRSSGSDSTDVMNTVGAGIYVEKAQYYAGTQAAQPNNTYLSIYSERYSNGTNSLRFRLWCCSNSTESNVGSITDPNGVMYTGQFKDKDLRVYLHYWSLPHQGCIRLDGSRHYASALRYDSGVYTCTIPDVSGKNHTIHFGLYDYNTQNVPSISRFYHEVDPSSVLKLICETKTAPPTEITWKKDGVKLTVNGNVTQTIIDRNSSHYRSTLSIEHDHVAKYIGTYTVIVGNSHGHNEEKITLEGIKITPSEGEIENGIYVGNLSHPVTFNCSSDLFPLSIEWSVDDNLLNESQSSNAMIEVLSTDDHEAVYACETINSRGSQELNFTINIKVPDDWASVDITDDTGREPLHDSNHTLTCTVKVKPGLNYDPEVHWYHPDGSQVQMEERVSESEVEIDGLTIIRKLEFMPVSHDDGGDYTCSAKVDILWASPPEKNSSFKLVVTTQEHMQLRIETLPHCSTWKPRKAEELEESIMKDIEPVVQEKCGHGFNSSEIHSGEFSCRTRRDAVTYRAIVNGSSETCNAGEIVDHIDTWKNETGTLLHGKFRLQLTTGCPIRFKSFSEQECGGDQEAECNNKGGLLFDSSTCYRFKSCDGDSDEGSAEE